MILFLLLEDASVILPRAGLYDLGGVRHSLRSILSHIREQAKDRRFPNRSAGCPISRVFLREVGILTLGLPHFFFGKYFFSTDATTT